MKNLTIICLVITYCYNYKILKKNQLDAQPPSLQDESECDNIYDQVNAYGKLIVENQKDWDENEYKKHVEEYIEMSSNAIKVCKSENDDFTRTPCDSVSRNNLVCLSYKFYYYQSLDWIINQRNSTWSQSPPYDELAFNLETMTGAKLNYCMKKLCKRWG